MTYQSLTPYILTRTDEGWQVLTPAGDIIATFLCDDMEHAVRIARLVAAGHAGTEVCIEVVD